MNRARIGGSLSALAIGLVALLSLTEITIAQEKKYDLTGEWAITKTGTYFNDPNFTKPDPLRLQKVDPNTFRIASELWPNTRLQFVDGKLKYFTESRAEGQIAKKLDFDPKTGLLRSIEWNDGSVWTPKEGRPPTSSDCPPNLAGNWGLPNSGKTSFQVSDNTVTGTIANLGGKFGLATVMGTLSGKTMNGTWKSMSGSGKITITGPDEACMIWMTFSTSVDVDPPPPGRGEPTTETTSGISQTSTSGGNPWETAAGKDCFEKWIALATRLINAADLGPTGNTHKPYSFGKYGLLLNNKVADSAGPPDDWERHNRNKYWYMWDAWNADDTGGQYRGTGPDGLGSAGGVLKMAKVPSLRDYVRRCAPGSPQGSTQEPPIGSGMYLKAYPHVIAKGQTVLAPVDILNAQDVTNLDFTLSYSPGIVSPAGNPQPGSAVSKIWEANLQKPGAYKFNFSQLTPFKGEKGGVAGFLFRGDTPGRTALTLTVWRVDGLKGDKLPITLINGSITVWDPDNPNDPNNPNNTDPPGPERQPTCSGTGRQTMNDAQCCLKMWVGLIDPPNRIMDVNGDGVVDSADARIVMQNVARRNN